MASENVESRQIKVKTLWSGSIRLRVTSFSWDVSAISEGELAHFSLCEACEVEFKNREVSAQ